MTAYIVINIRGTVNIPHGVKKTLKHLNLETRYRATVISDNKINQGMLLKAKEYLAWTKADSKIIAQLLKNKGEKSKTIKYSFVFYVTVFRFSEIFRIFETFVFLCEGFQCNIFEKQIISKKTGKKTHSFKMLFNHSH